MQRMLKFTYALNILTLVLGVLNLGFYLWLGGIFSAVAAICCFASSLSGFYMINKNN